MMEKPETVVIHSASSRDIWPEETNTIAEAVRKLNSEFNVKVEDHERTGVGVTWFEVLRITLLGGAFGVGKVFAEEVAKKIADIVVEWARERFKGRKSKSTRPVYVAIYGPDGIVKSVVIKNAVDEPEDRTEQDRQTAKGVSRQIADENSKQLPATPPAPTAAPTCNGQHLCPECQQVKTCAFGFCAVTGEVMCDSCLYLEEYGPKAAEIIEKAIAVGAMLHDASARLGRYFVGIEVQPWGTKEEARVWMNSADDALEQLDSSINRIHLRLKARFPRQ